jgi:hypothetical protein
MAMIGIREISISRRSFADKEVTSQVDCSVIPGNGAGPRGGFGRARSCRCPLPFEREAATTEVHRDPPAMILLHIEALLLRFRKEI